jgi:predicted esterase
MPSPSTHADPHASQPILHAGPAPERAAATVILVHGRGADAEGMLQLFNELGLPDTVAALAPQAAGHTWYPYSFLEPLELNQPYLDSALRRLGSIVDDLLARGVPAERFALLGFSQGACLLLEFAARNARRYGGVMGLSGGVIGPPGTPRDYPGTLDGTPVFLGCSDVDPHIPYARVTETADVFRRMSAAVDLRIYPGMPHTINQDEFDACRALLQRLANPT